MEDDYVYDDNISEELHLATFSIKYYKATVDIYDANGVDFINRVTVIVSEYDVCNGEVELLYYFRDYCFIDLELKDFYLIYTEEDNVAYFINTVLELENGTEIVVHHSRAEGDTNASKEYIPLTDYNLVLVGIDLNNVFCTSLPS